MDIYTIIVTVVVFLAFARVAFLLSTLQDRMQELEKVSSKKDTELRDLTHTVDSLKYRMDVLQKSTLKFKEKDYVEIYIPVNSFIPPYGPYSTKERTLKGYISKIILSYHVTYAIQTPDGEFQISDPARIKLLKCESKNVNKSK